MAKPTGVTGQTTDIERDAIPVDSNAADEPYRLARAKGVNTVGHYAVELNHELGPHLRKRDTPTCSTDCGDPPIKNCVALLETTDRIPSDTPFCVVNDITGFVNLTDCIFTFNGFGNKKVCIPLGKFNKVSKEILDHCVNNPAFGFGGCSDLEGIGRICVRNFDIVDPNTCV
jgi:hypothetical protein